MSAGAQRTRSIDQPRSEQLAKQIWDYYITNRRYATLLAPKTIALVGQILGKDVAGGTPQSPVKEQRRTRSSGTVQNKWPSEWELHKSHLAAAVRELHQGYGSLGQEPGYSEMVTRLSRKTFWGWPPLGPKSLREGHPLAPIPEDNAEPVPSPTTTVASREDLAERDNDPVAREQSVDEEVTPKAAQRGVETQTLTTERGEGKGQTQLIPSSPPDQSSPPLRSSPLEDLPQRRNWQGQRKEGGPRGRRANASEPPDFPRRFPTEERGRTRDIRPTQSDRNEQSRARAAWEHAASFAKGALVTGVSSFVGWNQPAGQRTLTDREETPAISPRTAPPQDVCRRDSLEQADQTQTPVTVGSFPVQQTLANQLSRKAKQEAILTPETSKKMGRDLAPPPLNPGPRFTTRVDGPEDSLTSDRRLRSLHLPQRLAPSEQTPPDEQSVNTERGEDPINAPRPVPEFFADYHITQHPNMNEDTNRNKGKEREQQPIAGPSTDNSTMEDRLTQAMAALINQQFNQLNSRLVALEGRPAPNEPASSSPRRQTNGPPRHTARGQAVIPTTERRETRSTTEEPELPTVLVPIDRSRYRGWKTKDVGFFYPNAPTSMGKGDRVRERGSTYYRMVTTFTRRVRTYAKLHPASPLRENLDGLLEGVAQEWWCDAVEEEDQVYYMTEPDGIEAWLKRLEDHFAPSPEDAEAHLASLSYSPADARHDRSVEEYLASVRAACRAFNEDTTENDVVYRAWKQLHPRLRRKVDRPERGTSMAEFRSLLLRKQTTWKSLPLKAGDDPDDRYALVTTSTMPTRRGEQNGWKYNTPFGRPEGAVSSSAGNSAPMAVAPAPAAVPGATGFDPAVFSQQLHALLQSLGQSAQGQVAGSSAPSHMEGVRKTGASPAVRSENTHDTRRFDKGAGFRQQYQQDPARRTRYANITLGEPEYEEPADQKEESSSEEELEEPAVQQ
ncbi:hypothetical protein AAP_00052 [Ascosphaera apis ARSEF 7405]|uniref:Uncharacterized protein n=1 Tax=Ascosphaera apis ARSEF 7405 TaxID=392613 RepID=A0A168DIV7_9EURO|nr:hypothetical protein AAP_00052 [Ascosphaera apis ARSEF 7405]